MTNPNGTPIWYELLTRDADASIAFYEAVIDGWSVGPPPSEGPMDYRMIDTGDGFVGGLGVLGEGMPTDMKPGWRFYIGVDDPDATAEAIKANGGQVHMEPFDMEGVGRMAYCSDPQGNPFYVMRGASEESSTAWDRMAMGKCNWNELATSDRAAGDAFYAAVFGWTYPDRMTMPGDMGDYVFVEAGGETIGATMKAGAGEPTGWRFYFRTPDIHAARATVEAKGGTVHAGPMEVPGGDWIIVAHDPHGVDFGVVAPAPKES